MYKFSFRRRRSWLLGLAILLIAVPEHAIADSASCQRAVAALTKMPEVEVLDERAAHFAYKPGGAIDLLCAAAIDLTIGVSPLPGPEFWPFFGRLARVLGVEPSEAIKAAQACRTSGERYKANGKGLFEGDRFDTPTLQFAIALRYQGFPNGGDQHARC